MIQTPPSWNLFVTVFLDILRPRQADLDTVQYRAKVHPEKIRRLKESRDLQGKFPVLNPKELEQVKVVFALSDYEESQLVAATLATAIEAKLVPRVGARAALKAAQAMLPILADALQEAEYALDHPFQTIRYGGPMDIQPMIEVRFAEALEAIDTAILAYYMGLKSRDERQRHVSVEEARREFTHALEVLERADALTRHDPVWQMWHEEAYDGLQQLDALI